MADDYSRDYIENDFYTAASNPTNENGFVMKDAPWEKADKKDSTAPNTQSQEDFPAVGGAPITFAPMTSVWGPKH